MNIVIVDCQNDFVSGTLACTHGEEAVKNISDFITDDMNVYYTLDYHPENHISFVDYGGQWPPHCVENTYGSEIHKN